MVKEFLKKLFGSNKVQQSTTNNDLVLIENQEELMKLLQAETKNFDMEAMQERFNRLEKILYHTLTKVSATEEQIKKLHNFVLEQTAAYEEILNETFNDGSDTNNSVTHYSSAATKEQTKTKKTLLN